MEKFGSALVPDFQEHYGLRLTEVLETWHPTEALLLVQGLPINSRFSARLSGEKTGRGWSEPEWMMLDIRNAVEALRVMRANEGRKRNDPGRVKPREWEHYPGAESLKRRKTESKVDRMRRYVKERGGKVTIDR